MRIEEFMRTKLNNFLNTPKSKCSEKMLFLNRMMKTKIFYVLSVICRSSNVMLLLPAILSAETPFILNVSVNGPNMRWRTIMLLNVHFVEMKNLQILSGRLRRNSICWRSNRSTRKLGRSIITIVMVVSWGKLEEVRLFISVCIVKMWHFVRIVSS